MLTLNECILRVINNDIPYSNVINLAIRKHVKNYKRMSKQQLVRVLWGDEDTRKKPCTQQVLNQSTAQAVETE